MSNRDKFLRFLLILVVLSLTAGGVLAQKKKDPKGFPRARVVMWEPVNVARQDLFLGPGGDEMAPDLSSISFIRRETGGYNKKYRIRDGSGRVWVAKYGREAKPETVSVRLLSALGYKTEINYFVPELTIPGVGMLRNVRLEARPEHIDRLKPWEWRKNPFRGTNEFQGLKIMMAFLNNWDLLTRNNVVLFDKRSRELNYANSDLGATFGNYGSNNLPIFWRFGRSIGKPRDYSRSKFIKGVKKGRIQFAFKGKGSGMFRDITVAQGRWLANLLTRLSDEQIADAFRAADYSPSEISLLTESVRGRIYELDRATSSAIAER